MDLAREWRSRRWRRLLNFIDGLPRHSAFIEALADDEEYAAMVVEAGWPERSPHPRLSEYTPEREALDAVVDRLGEVVSAVIAAAGVRPPKIKPQPRPRTAVDRLRARKRRLDHESLVAKLLPHRRT